MPEAIASPTPGHLTVDHGVAWLVLDDPAKRVNTLSRRMFDWFSDQIEAIESGWRVGAPASGSR
jgi:enoyl-CoA hydratase/carnithine racemase